LFGRSSNCLCHRPKGWRSRRRMPDCFLPMEPSSHEKRPSQRPIQLAKARVRYRVSFTVLAVLSAALGIGTVFHRAAHSSKVEIIGYTDLMARAASGVVEKAEIEGERIGIMLKGGASAVVFVSNAQSQHAIVSMLVDKGIAVEFASRESGGER